MLVHIYYCCLNDAVTHGARFGFVCARIELAETLEVSGGTHVTRGEVLTRVRLGKLTRNA